MPWGATSDPRGFDNAGLGHNPNVLPGRYRIEVSYAQAVPGVEYEIYLSQPQSEVEPLIVDLSPGLSLELGGLFLTPKAEYRREVRLCTTYYDNDEERHPAEGAEVKIYGYEVGFGAVVTTDIDGCASFPNAVIGSTLALKARWLNNASNAYQNRRHWLWDHGPLGCPMPAVRDVPATGELESIGLTPSSENAYGNCW